MQLAPGRKLVSPTPLMKQLARGRWAGQQLKRPSGELAALDMTDTLHFTQGNTSYPGILLPDVAPMFENFARDTPAFTEYHDNMSARGQAFTIKLSQVPAATPGNQFHELIEKIAEDATDPDAAVPFLQGAGHRWQCDKFVGQLIGYTFLATLLQPVPGGFMLDLSTASRREPASQLQELKRAAVALAPVSLLRTRGLIREVDGMPRLMRVEVQDYSGRWLIFKPQTGETEWGLAKVALLAMALFTVECFHTGIHLYSSAVVMALQKSVKVDHTLAAITEQRATFVLNAMLQQASALHANHNSAFSGAAWDCNITHVWKVTTDIARFFFKAPPAEILGLLEPIKPSGSKNRQQTPSIPSWWAGMASVFMDPIQSFVTKAAKAVLLEGRAELEVLRQELQFIGIWQPDSGLDVTSVSGLAHLYGNMMFVQGVAHTHMYATREQLTSLGGFTTTDSLLPFLIDSQSLNLTAALDKAYPESTAQMKVLASLLFGTASGFDSGVPELGEGAWHNYKQNQPLADAISSFQAEVKASRQTVQDAFQKQSGGFTPSYYFPVSAPKPFGFGITQTTYV